MKKLIFSFTLLILLSCGKEKADERIYSIDKFMQGQVDFFKFNGNILVAEKGQMIYQKSFGVADFYTNQPLNDSSVFELASVSKQFTAMGILILKKQGKLNLSDSLRSYFPELPYSNITINNLLTHTSGLPDYEEAMKSKWNHKKIAFNIDVIGFLAKERPPVHFKPGVKWEYSNTAYAILASIIEKVSGMTFKDFMAKNVFEPLNMRHSRVYNARRSGETIKNYAYGFVWSDSLSKYVVPDSLPEYDFVYYLDGIQGDGTINSTTRDLLKWDRGIASQTLLGESTSKEFLFPHILCDTVLNVYYGYGVFVGKNQFGNYVHHAGGWPGYGTNLARYIDVDKTIIVLSNNQSASTAIQGTIANILFNQTIEYPYKHTPIKLDTTLLDLFTGTYSVKNSKFDIIRERDSLFQVFTSGTRRTFLPESNSMIFSNDEFDIQFEIVKDTDNKLKYHRILYGVRDEMVKLK